MYDASDYGEAVKIGSGTCLSLLGNQELMDGRTARKVSADAVSKPHRRVGKGIHSCNEDGNWLLGYGIQV
jgi:hypothetical protein